MTTHFRQTVSPKPIILTALFISLNTFAAWEDPPPQSAAVPGVRQTPVAPQVQPQRVQTQPQQQRQYWQPVAPYQPPTSQGAQYVAPPQTQAKQAADSASRPEKSAANDNSDFGDIYSVHLDTIDVNRPRGYFFRYHLDASIADDDDKKNGVGELGADWMLFDWHGFLFGELRLDFNPRVLFFSDDADYSRMPAALLEFPFIFEETWRWDTGWSFRLGAAPGIYTDAEAISSHSFFCPFSLIFYYAVNPTFSLKGGVDVRLGWYQEAMPNLGIAWQPFEAFLLELGLPRSQLTITAGPVTLYGIGEWRSRSFHYEDDKDSSLIDTFTLEDIRMGAGLRIAFSDNFAIAAEIGVLLDRDLVLDGESGSDELEQDDTKYFGISVLTSF